MTLSIDGALTGRTGSIPVAPQLDLSLTYRELTEYTSTLGLKRTLFPRRLSSEQMDGVWALLMDTMLQGVQLEVESDLRSQRLRMTGVPQAEGRVIIPVVQLLYPALPDSLSEEATWRGEYATRFTYNRMPYPIRVRWFARAIDYDDATQLATIEETRLITLQPDASTGTTGEATALTRYRFDSGEGKILWSDTELTVSRLRFRFSVERFALASDVTGKVRLTMQTSEP